MKARDVSGATVPHSAAPESGPPPSWVEKSPGVCGGDARIRKTRITVWGLVEWRSLGLSDAEILEHHPDLTQADLETAWEYYSRHQQEIDQAIRDNAEARSGWRASMLMQTSAHGSSPSYAAMAMM